MPVRGFGAFAAGFALLAAAAGASAANVTGLAITPNIAADASSPVRRLCVSFSIAVSSLRNRRSFDVRLARGAAVQEFAAVRQRDLLEQPARLTGPQRRDDHGD